MTRKSFSQVGLMVYCHVQKWSYMTACSILYLSLSLMTWADMTRLALYLLGRATMRDPHQHHISGFGSYVSATLISSPIEEPLIRMSLFHDETTHGAMFKLFQLRALQDRHPYDVVTTGTNRSLPPWGSETHPTHSLSCGIFLAPICSKSLQVLRDSQPTFLHSTGIWIHWI